VAHGALGGTPVVWLDRSDTVGMTGRSVESNLDRIHQPVTESIC